MSMARNTFDASGLNATCGYRHPDVLRAVRDQLARLYHVDLSVASHEPVGLLAERLSSYLPEMLSKTLFVNCGSEGFDAAMLIAAAYWSYVSEKRDRVVTFARGYHGFHGCQPYAFGTPPTGHSLRDPMQVTHVELPVPPRELRRPESLPLLVQTFEHAIADGDRR